jgi:hypothetical protein
VIATSLLPLTNELFHRVASMPLVPALAWSTGHAQLSIGLGDLLLATVFPPVMHRAFGQTPAAVAAGVSLAAIAGMAAALELANVQVAIPVMTVLGPLMVGQYCFWIRRYRSERAMWQYLSADAQGIQTVEATEGVTCEA